MKCTDSIMHSKLLRPLIFVIVSQLIKPSPFTSLWSGFVSVDFSFQKMLGSMENSHYFLPSIKRTLILRVIIIYL